MLCVLPITCAGCFSGGLESLEASRGTGASAGPRSDLFGSIRSMNQRSDWGCSKFRQIRAGNAETKPRQSRGKSTTKCRPRPLGEARRLDSMRSTHGGHIHYVSGVPAPPRPPDVPRGQLRYDYHAVLFGNGEPERAHRNERGGVVGRWLRQGLRAAAHCGKSKSGWTAEKRPTLTA